MSSQSHLCILGGKKIKRMISVVKKNTRQNARAGETESMSAGFGRNGIMNKKMLLCWHGTSSWQSAFG